eukprot:2497181-Amphidinium_carterae.1
MSHAGLIAWRGEFFENEMERHVSYVKKEDDHVELLDTLLDAEAATAWVRSVQRFVTGWPHDTFMYRIQTPNLDKPLLLTLGRPSSSRECANHKFVSRARMQPTILLTSGIVLPCPLELSFQSTSSILELLANSWASVSVTCKGGYLALGHIHSVAMFAPPCYCFSQPNSH